MLGIIFLRWKKEGYCLKQLVIQITKCLINPSDVCRYPGNHKMGEIHLFEDSHALFADGQTALVVW